MPKRQDPEAEGVLNRQWPGSPSTQKAPARTRSEAIASRFNEPTEAERLAQGWVQEAACEDAVAAYVDVAGLRA